MLCVLGGDGGEEEEGRLMMLGVRVLGLGFWYAGVCAREEYVEKHVVWWKLKSAV